MIRHYHSKPHVRENIITLKEEYPHEFGNFIMALKNLEDSDDWPRICGIHGNTFKPNDPCVLCPTDVDTVLKNGHGWATDHIATSKDDVEEVYNFLKSEETIKNINN